MSYFGGTRLRIFAREYQNRLHKVAHKKYVRVCRDDARSGFYSIAGPYTSIILVLMYVGTMVGDKQKELREVRKQKVTQRELSLAQENDLMRQWLVETEKDYANVPVPGGRGSEGLLEGGGGASAG
ncbi:unnamed protein product [Amoebophrya sp. A120]|nr:unnamed protein product [Amoebophrya sp. A120]|eukprot:GSA120T00012089001.1